MAVEKWIEDLDSTITQSTTTVKSKVFIYGGFGGRFDQEMGCMNALYVWGRKQKFRHTSIALYGEETCAFLLLATPTINEIRIPFPDGHYIGKSNGHDELVGEGPSCGLIPLGGRCDKVVTSGLKWNLNGEMPMEFGGLVSSSNRVMDVVVYVQTSSPMIFTTEMINRL
jgi:thiamine pyrophosphokinase